MPPSPYIYRAVFVFGIVFPLATFAGVIFVAAHKDDSPAHAIPLHPADSALTPHVFEVTNVNDSDSGSLRDAIIKANATPGLAHTQESNNGTIRIAPKHTVSRVLSR